MLILGGWLSEWYRVPRDLLIFMGVVNLAYASYSLSLASRAERPMKLIILLAAANMTWGLVCWRWAFVYYDSVSVFGLAHFVGEGLFVAALACLEWRWREQLQTA